MNWMALIHDFTPYIVTAILALLGWNNWPAIKTFASQASGKLGRGNANSAVARRRRVFDAVTTLQTEAVACGACPGKVDQMRLSEIAALAGRYQPDEPLPPEAP